MDQAVCYQSREGVGSQDQLGEEAESCTLVAQCRIGYIPSPNHVPHQFVSSGSCMFPYPVFYVPVSYMCTVYLSLGGGCLVLIWESLLVAT